VYNSVMVAFLICLVLLHCLVKGDENYVVCRAAIFVQTIK
jgi:hypothetical protein